MTLMPLSTVSKMGSSRRLSAGGATMTSRPPRRRDENASAGAGVTLSPGEATEETIRDAVSCLLSDPSFTDAARRLGASIDAMPSPEAVAAILESVR